MRAQFSEIKGIEVTDLYIWRVAPNAHACEMVVYNNCPKGTEFYRDRILKEFSIEHMIIEERACVH